MSSVVQGVVAFDLTGTNRAVGTVVFFQGVAQLFTNPIGGAYADRINKKKIMFACQTVIGSVFLITGILIATDVIRIAFLAVGSFAVGMSFSFLGPSRQAFVANIMDDESRGNAVALNQVALNASRMVGPLVGSALIGWALLGAPGTYFVMAALYAAALVSIVFLPDSPPAPGANEGSIVSDIREGVRYVAHNPRLRVLLLLFVAVMMIGFPYITVLPGFVENELDESTSSIGLLLFAMAAGGLFASVSVAGLADSSRAPFVYLVGGVTFGAGLVGTGFMPSLPLAMVTMFVAGVGTGAFQTLSGALILRGTAPGYFGRVQSLTMLAFAGFGLMALPVGFAADAMGERTTLITMGGVVCIAVLGAALLFGSVLSEKSGVPSSSGSTYR